MIRHGTTEARYASTGGALLRSRQRVLSREEEIEVAQTIEEAEESLFVTLAESPIALGELAAMAEELRQGLIPLVEFAPIAMDEGRESQEVVTVTLEAVKKAQEARTEAAANDAPGTDGLRDFVAMGRKLGLSRRAVEILLNRLAGSDAPHAHASDDAPMAWFGAMRGHKKRLDRARDVLIEANLGMVVWMANKRVRHGLSLADLVQEGSLGLLRAAEKYDYRRGIRFNTYASWWIRHFINRALSDQSRTIRIPVHLLEARSQVRRALQAFRQEYGRSPTETELAERAGVSVDKVQAVLAIPSEPTSMDAPAGPESDGRIGDFVPDPDAKSAVDWIADAHAERRLRHLLTTLTPREREVLELRFGIDRSGGLTLAEIGQRFSLSRERIRQIEAEALLRLRDQAKAEELDAHLH